MEEYNRFRDFISAHKDSIYNTICNYMPKGKPEKFNNEIIRCYVDRKGKYGRPAYLLLWSLLYGGNIEDAMLPAAAQQLSEDSILKHDDMIDNNHIRRGAPAAHVLYGDNYAMIGGDALFAIVFKIASDAAYSLGKFGRTYFNKFSDMMLKTMQGQYLDVNLTTLKDITKFTLEDYYESIHAKTAYYTVYGPMQCGAIIAGADKEAIDSIPLYGVPAGNAFQIQDDILDCTSTEAELGKSIGNDIKEGVKTLILWHAVQHASSASLERLKSIYSKRREDKTPDDIQFVIDTFNDLGSIDFARSEAEKLISKALKEFDSATSLIEESWVKKVARDSINYNVKRTG
jgi:geranylgeranyl pyrophosphate synthase